MMETPMRYSELLESGAVNKGKKFEDDIVTLALLNGESPNEDLEKLYDSNSSKFLSPSLKSQTIATVTGLNKRFPEEKWTKGFNSNQYQSSMSPNYGQPSAKSDIVLNNISFSVKMSGSFVVLSAQSKTEFGGCFQYAMNRYAQDKSLDIDLDEQVQRLQKTIVDVRDNYIGEVFEQVKDKKRQLSVVDKFSDTKDLYSELQNYMNKMEGKIVDKYKEAIDDLKKDVLVQLKTNLDENQELKEYITWEALSATLKYDGKFPDAPYVLSPKGVADISRPDTPYVKACASESKFSIRGLPTGGMRSGSSTYAKQQKTAYSKGNVDIASIFSGIGAMALNLKIDISDLTSKNLPVDEAIDLKALWNRFVSTMKNFISMIKKKFDAILAKTKDLSQATIGDWLAGIGAEPVGQIRMV